MLQAAFLFCGAILCLIGMHHSCSEIRDHLSLGIRGTIEGAQQATAKGRLESSFQSIFIFGVVLDALRKTS